MDKAFSRALALESLPDELKKMDIPAEVLVKYARTVAFKVFHNLQFGRKMDPAEDPLTVGNVPAPQAWPSHYQDNVPLH